MKEPTTNRPEARLNPEQNYFGKVRVHVFNQFVVSKQICILFSKTQNRQKYYNVSLEYNFSSPACSNYSLEAWMVQTKGLSLPHNRGCIKVCLGSQEIFFSSFLSCNSGEEVCRKTGDFSSVVSCPPIQTKLGTVNTKGTQMNMGFNVFLLKAKDMKRMFTVQNVLNRLRDKRSLVVRCKSSVKHNSTSLAKAEKRERKLLRQLQIQRRDMQRPGKIQATPATMKKEEL